MLVGGWLDLGNGTPLSSKAQRSIAMTAEAGKVRMPLGFRWRRCGGQLPSGLTIMHRRLPHKVFGPIAEADTT